MNKWIKVLIVFILAAFFVIGGTALAQLIIPATEPGGTATINMTPSYISGDPAYQNMNPPDDNAKSGAYNPAANYSYYQVSGSTLKNRSSATQYTYDGLGCTHTTSGIDTQKILNTELNLPNHAVIKYLRVYFRDTNPNSGVDGYISRYKPGLEAIDLVGAGSSDAFQGDFGYVVSQEITQTVDNELYVYTLIGYPDENNVANQICGLRVAYYPPYNGRIYLPTVHR